MYDEENVIDVRVSTIDGERKDPLVEYTPQPNSALSEQNKIEHGPNVCYITPPAGQRFAVDVCVHRHASFMGQPEFDVRCTVDGLFEADHGIVKPPGRKRVHALTQTLDTYQAVIGGRRYQCGFAFAAVKTNDDPSFMSDEEEDLAIREMGKIEVVLQRGRDKSKKKKKSKDPERTLLDSCTRQNEVTKKVSKDNGKALFTKPLPLQTVQPRATDREHFFVAATGDAGKKIKFVFYYTTKLYLQIQQIVPIITKGGLRSEPVVVDEDDATPSPVTPNTAHDSQDQEIVFTGTRPIKIENDAITIKDEPESDEEGGEEEEDEDEDTDREPADSAADLHSEGANTAIGMNAFRSPRPSSEDEEEDLYTSSVSPRHIRGPSISSDTFAMHGGLGEPSASRPRPSVRFAESVDSSPASQSQTLSKRKAPHEMDAAERKVEDAELALLEIQAKRRLNAARKARDSLVPFAEE